MARRRRRHSRTRANARLDGWASAPWFPAAAAAGGAGLLLLVWLSRKRLASNIGGSLEMASGLFGKAVTAGKELAFGAALPSALRAYAGALLVSAAKFGVSPWLLAGVLYRESSGGMALKPPGPAGTGDFLARSSTSTYFKYANPSTGLPADGLGWGRGLMQIDYGAHNAWVTTHDWRDPQQNIDYAASILAGHQSYFSASPGGAVSIDPWRISAGYSAGGKLLVAPWSQSGISTATTSARDPRPITDPAKLAEASLAAYNAGRGGVLQALAVGLSPAKATANGDYADWILSRVSTWLAAFPG